MNFVLGTMNFVHGTRSGGAQMKHVRRADDYHFENSITDPVVHDRTTLINLPNQTQKLTLNLNSPVGGLA